MSLYLIKRKPHPTYQVRWPLVVVCDRKRVAKEVAGNTSDQASIWVQSHADLARGWLLVRHRGLDIDYWPVVTSHPLFDGTKTAYYHDRQAEPWTLLAGAIWYSHKPLPPKLQEYGVVYAQDRWTQREILEDIANDGITGITRERPVFWPVPEVEA